MSPFTLVVFGGRVYDIALATDFVIIGKKFITDGLNPTCLSGTNLYDITNICGPFLFGREDLRARVPIYDSQEAMRPLYRLEAHGLKSHIINWIRFVSGQVRPGDRIIIVPIGHGNQRDSAVTLSPQHVKPEFLSKAEMVGALSILPPKVRLLIVNEACYSGTWATIAADVGAQRDMLVETAATLGERSWTYTSGSGRDRCSLFGAAFVEELTTYP
ncbi:hypothetical protein DTO169E5_8513 [Paecilomyces variotii]|nr:hypothetical protein DTO169E5_8513 [Paecilomyces variotii]